MEEFYLRSNGAGRLHCVLWKPEGEARAVIQLVHGIAEHTGRYAEFAGFLTKHGFAVAAEDHMGHGASIEDGTQGYFSGGWMAAVADVHLLREHMKTLYPSAPYWILGHSMGSFLLRTYLYTYPQSIDAAVISGTGWEETMTLKAGKLLCAIEEKRLGEKKVSGLLNGIMFGSYNKPFQPVRTPHDWICSVQKVVDAYEADPLCGFDATVGLARDMMDGISRNEKKENLEKMCKSLPVLFVSGEKDPVGRMGKGVLACIDAFKRAGMRNITIKIYPEGRHEMLNERNREEVWNDVLNWFTDVAEKAAKA